ncbi:MAG: protein-glutamine glutaminase family protein [Pseudobdellovibrionaceae bacterium]
MKNLRALLSFFLLLFLLITAQAEESAQRDPLEDWTQAQKREQTVWRQNDNLELFGSLSAVQSATPYSPQIDVRNLPAWSGSDAELQEAFLRLRDERLYFQSNRPNFPRRSSWLYPDDGCYARAAHAAQSFERAQKERPGKVFAFGNLRVKTKYHRRGTVYWWFHVAAAYRIGNEAVILDPSIEALRPLPLSEWLQRISSRPLKTKVAICDTYAYATRHACLGGSSRQESRFQNHQKAFLVKEWDRLKSLRYEPEKLLGEQPPWRKNLHPLPPIGQLKPEWPQILR